MKTYKKIDLYYAGDYLCSTTQSKTCRDAVKAYLDRIEMRNYYNGLVDRQILKNKNQLEARFAKGGVK